VLLLHEPVKLKSDEIFSTLVLVRVALVCKTVVMGIAMELVTHLAGPNWTV
jgi:hypothetical protein